MAENEGAEDNAPRGNEWEVVSLTASTYEASPGPKDVKLNNDENEGGNGRGEVETSHALFMSDHFVFPPSQHENLPLEPDDEIHDIIGGKGVVFAEEVGRTSGKDEENCALKRLANAEDFPGISFLDKKGEMLSIRGKQFEGGTGLEGLSSVDKGDNIYTNARYCSFRNDGALSGTTYGEETVITESNEPSEEGLNLSQDVSSSEDVPQKEKEGFISDIPSEAWWKRRAVSVYAHAKEANAFWSVFVAAAVTGLVILGQHWQKERWQALQMKWQLSLRDEGMSRLMGPISRLKDVFVGGHRRGSLLRSGS